MSTLHPLTKPPTGLMPQYVHIENRVISIKEALWRYIDAKHSIPLAWIYEYNSLVQSLKEVDENGQCTD